MSNLPQFMPEGTPTEAINAGIASANASQSWMNQGQERAIRAAQEARQQQQFETFLPALHAKAMADQIAQNNDAASAMAQQTVRAQWQSLKPQVIADMAAIEEPGMQKLQPDGTPDWDAKYHAYETLEAKYGALSLLPEGKAYFSMIENAKKNAFDSAMKHNMAQMALDRTQAMLEGRLTQTAMTNQGRTDVATINAGARTQAAETSAGARTDSATIAAQGHVDAAKQRANHTYELEKMKALRDDALDRGDQAGAAIFDARIQKLNHITVSSGEAMQQIMGDGGTAQPKSTIVTPAAPKPSAAAPKAPVQVNSWDDAKQLEPGTPYIGPDGKPYVRGNK